MKSEEIEEKVTSRGLFTSFWEIASQCNEQECREIIRDYGDPEICEIYEKRLRQLENRHHET